MDTYKGKGNRLTATAPSGGVESGDVVVVRSGATGMIGVAVTDADASESYEVEITGIHELPKATGTAHAFALGDIVYWDVADGNCQKTASANVKAGIAAAAAGANATTVQVLLIPSKA